jgi:glycosyltransferase involved in cell wall biosynthesis
VKPLHLVTVAGFISMLGSIAMLIYIIVSVAMGRAVSGWGSMMFSLWFLGGLILISLGIIGEYIGRIYLEAKNRPRYIIEKEL